MNQQDENLLTNIRTVKELILDEQKFVSYVSLSKDLCIHVNEAKLLLSQVVKDINEKETSLNISYIISGLLDSHTARTIVCSESDLKARKKEFKTLFFEHIYSVSQGSPRVDNAALLAINKFEDFPLYMGLIKAPLCAKRSLDEIGTLKSNCQLTADETKTTLKENNEKPKDVSQNGHKNDKTVVKVHESKSDPIIKKEVTSPKKVATIKSNGKNGSKPTKGIAGFFSKSNSAPSVKLTKANKETYQESDTKEKLLPVSQEVSMDVDEEQIDIKEEPESTKKGKTKKNNSLTQIKKNAKIDKKRKRVLHVSDSESDTENDPFADEQPANESEDEIPPTPATNTVKITSGILNPKKRRKVVDKTYTDDEGYILTRKEEVYESCSDDETEIVKREVPSQVKSEKENVLESNKEKTEISPKQKGKNSKKKVSPPQKGKQATLTSFFKKV